MASREAIAIRAELAQRRITEAAKQLSAQSGKPIPQIDARARDPYLERAILAEQTADLLESLLAVQTKPVKPGQKSTGASGKAKSDGKDKDGTDDQNDAPGASVTLETGDSSVDSKEQADGNNDAGAGSKPPARQTKKPSSRGKTKRK